MRRRTLIGLLLIAGMAFPEMVLGQRAEEALSALKKMKTGTMSGISYEDYATVLGKVQFQVEQFLEPSRAKDTPELADKMAYALQTYRRAGTVWSMKYTFNTVRYFITISTDGGKQITSILDSYPEINKASMIRQFHDRPSYHISTVISELFGKANKAVDEISALLAKDQIRPESEGDEIERLKLENEMLRNELSELHEKCDY